MGKEHRQSSGGTSSSSIMDSVLVTQEERLPQEQELLLCTHMVGGRCESLSDMQDGMVHSRALGSECSSNTSNLSPSASDCGFEVGDTAEEADVRSESLDLSTKGKDCLEQTHGQGTTLTSILASNMSSVVKLVDSQDCHNIHAARNKGGIVRTSSAMQYTPLACAPLESLQHLEAQNEAAIVRKVNHYMLWRICLICFFNYLDRYGFQQSSRKSSPQKG
jgi:hypothetical protein